MMTHDGDDHHGFPSFTCASPFLLPRLGNHYWASPWLGSGLKSIIYLHFGKQLIEIPI